MSSTKSSPKRNKKVSSDPALLGYDLLYQLAYMSAVASAGVPRHEIFAAAAQLPTSAAPYFEEVERLVYSMRYRYAEACRVVGERADAPEVTSLLLRMSSFLNSGEPEKVFLQHEANLQADSYRNAYEGALESLKKWTDAFAALAVSSALIVVVASISTVIFDLGNPFVIGLILVMLTVNGFGVWVLWRASPKEIKILDGPEGYIAQRKPRTLFIILAPSVLLLGAFMVINGTPMGQVLLMSGVLLFPIGFFANRFDASVTKLDKDVATFLRVLGTTATSVGTTPGEALSKIDMRSVAHLAPAVERLHTDLRSRAKPELCWKRLVNESGSELIRRAVRIFIDGIRMGADAEAVGARASSLATEVSVLRDKRQQVSQTFGWLTVAMHTSIVFLLMFVIEIVGGFGDLVSNAGISEIAQQGGASSAASLSFSFGNMALLRQLVVPVVVVLSFVNALAPKVADGGYVHKFFHYLSLTLIASGIAMVTAPRVATWIFSATAAPP